MSFEAYSVIKGKEQKQEEKKANKEKRRKLHERFMTSPYTPY